MQKHTNQISASTTFYQDWAVGDGFSVFLSLKWAYYLYAVELL